MGIAAAVIGGAATIGSAAIGASGAQSAANTQANAANQAAATQLSMFNQTRQSLQPFIGAGTGAISQLASLFGFGAGGNGQPNANAAMSQLTQFPGYQFGLQQGGLALDRSAASQGLELSGAQLQAAQQFGTNYATQQAWNPYISELNQVSTLGANAAAGVGTQATAAAGQIGASQLAAGSATAAGQASTANILGSGLTQLLSGTGSSYGGLSGAFGGGYPNYGSTAVTPGYGADLALNGGAIAGANSYASDLGLFQ